MAISTGYFVVSHCLCVRTIIFELKDIRTRHLACWFILSFSSSLLKDKVTGQSLRPKEENKSSATAGWPPWLKSQPDELAWSTKTVAKVVGATSSGGFLVLPASKR